MFIFMFVVFLVPDQSHDRVAWKWPDRRGGGVLRKGLQLLLEQCPPSPAPRHDHRDREPMSSFMFQAGLGADMLMMVFAGALIGYYFAQWKGYQPSTRLLGLFCFVGSRAGAMESKAPPTHFTQRGLAPNSCREASPGNLFHGTPCGQPPALCTVPRRRGGSGGLNRGCSEEWVKISGGDGGRGWAICRSVTDGNGRWGE